jgi:hypothetical protein
MWQNLDVLFLINVFKNKIYCCSILGTVDLRVPTKQIRDLSTLDASRLIPSTRCIMATDICKYLDIFNKHNISLQDTFSWP